MASKEICDKCIMKFNEILKFPEEKENNVDMHCRVIAPQWMPDKTESVIYKDLKTWAANKKDSKNSYTLHDADSFYKNTW